MEHKSENKICQNCHKNFTIESEDFNFYEKINVPAPTWCPECRMTRRLAFNNTWSIFWRNCDKCGVRTLSEYPAEKKFTVYCQKCWWGDGWDGTEYGMGYDPGRPFFEQLKELMGRTPWVALESQYTSLKNSEYSNSIAWSKNSYLVFWADYCENVFYSSILNGLKWSSDCMRGWNSELCYGSIGFTNNYRTFFSDQCDSCVDVWFSRNCYGCTNCIGCVNLRNASHCIFNEKYSKEEYEKKMGDLELDSWAGLQKLEKKAKDFSLRKPYREYNGDSFNMNVSGDHIYWSRNTKEGYIVNNAENSKWCQLITVQDTKDCYDYTGWGNGAQLIYECSNVGENAGSSKFSCLCFPDALNLEYCMWNIAGKNNFGCVNLKRKKYCILNKEYSKEEFETLKAQIVADMKKNPQKDDKERVWSYGEFFPLSLCPFPYNHSNAIKFVPKDKAQALKEGYGWADMELPVHKITLQVSLLPDKIKDTEDNILNEVIGCDECKRGYKIVKGELDLLRKMNLPVPHKCPKCRENERFDRMTKPRMYHRQCDKCKTKIYTPYAPQDPRIVYCVQCYQAEFL